MSSRELVVGSPKELSNYLARPGVLEALQQSAAGKIDLKRVGKIVCGLLSDPKNSALLRCSMASLFTSISECVSLGLEPRLGRAYFVPYGDKCTLILGYQGMLDLARNAGVTATVHAVFEADRFLFEEGTIEKITHIPNLDAERTEATFKYAYVVTRYPNGEIAHTVMTKKEIDSIRRRSKAGNTGPWATDYVEMAKKTVVRRAAKNWPLSTEAMEVYERDDNRTFEDVPVVRGTDSATAAIRQRLLNNGQEQGTEPNEEVIDAEVKEEPEEERIPF